MKISLLQIFIISFCMIGATSTLYSVSANFTISYERSYDELAYVTYQQSIYQKGWNYLRVYANERKSLLDQHRGAGFLEGYVTYRQIYSAYQNLVGSIIKGEQLSVKTQDFIDQQLEYIDNMVQNHPRDIYWQYAGAYLEQLRYMYRGYLTRINVQKTLYMYIGFSQFYYLTNVGDLEDLIPAFHDPSQMQSHIQHTQSQESQQSAPTQQQEPRKPGNCNGYVKLLNGKLYVGHSTHNIYQFLLRIFKTYHFPTRDSNVGSQWFAFSSRPGDLISKDDFYVLSNGLIIMETSFSNLNIENYLDLSPKTVPCWLRATIATNLARTGTQWIDYFLKSRSGTHNNQWVIIDPSKLSTMRDVVNFVEEGFSMVEVVDVTEMLQSKGYVGSYNVPYTKKIYHKLGYEKYPYTYENDPRAYEYQKYDKLINNVEDMKKWLLNNDNEDPKIGLAPRYDLDKKSPTPFGLTDLKIISPQTLQNNYIWAISGPSTSNGKFEPFTWDNWPNSPHYGLPRKWNFAWEKYQIIQPEAVIQRGQSVQNKRISQQII